MKPNYEELAKIFHNELTKGSFRGEWKNQLPKAQERITKAMRAAMEHLFSTSEGVPSVEECAEAYGEGEICNGGADPFLCGLAAVRNAIMLPMLAKQRELEERLEKVRELPEKWRDHSNSVLNYACAQDLECALSTPATLEPVPEVAQPAQAEKWADEKAAFAKGLKIESRQEGGPWGLSEEPRWFDYLEYRIAPGQDTPLTDEQLETQVVEEALQSVETDPYADLRAAAEAGKWMQCKAGVWWSDPTNNHAKEHWAWSLPVENYRILETFNHNGKTYFRHRPGDEMAVGPEVEVTLLYNSNQEEQLTVRAGRMDWGERNHDSLTKIIGYYPTALAESLGNVDKPQTPIDLISKTEETFEQDGVVWTRHKPDDLCSLVRDTRIEVIRRNGERENGTADGFEWSCDDSPFDIIGYRLADPPTEPESIDPFIQAIKQRDEALDRIKELEAENVSIQSSRSHWSDLYHAEGNKVAILEQARDDWKCRHDSIKRQADEAIEKLRADVEVWKLAHKSACEDHEKERACFESKLSSAEIRLAKCLPRPVSVRPSPDDGDANGDVLVWYHDGGWQSMGWNTNFHTDKDAVAWIPCLARLAPELLPKPEDKNRQRFEQSAVAKYSLSLTRDDDGEYRDSRTRCMFDVWNLAQKDSK